MTKLIIFILILLLITLLTLKYFFSLKNSLIITLVIGITLVSAIIFGLSTNSLKGNVIRTEQDEQLSIECNVPYLFTQGEQVGYYCSIKVTEQTIIRNQKGENLSIEDIEDKLVSVVLSKRHIFTKDGSSREVTAKEIILVR